MNVNFSKVGIIGAGAMGRGIAQIAAQAGSEVLLLDSFEGAAARGRDAIVAQWQKQHEKGKLDAAQRDALGARIHAVDSMQALAGCELVIEAVVEDLEVKRKLFQELEAVVAPTATLATNTSSLSVTAIAAVLAHPERMAGFHFFNPVPLMKVVEVVAGFKTEPEVCKRLAGYAAQMGHSAVQAKDTPGFIVNHAGRGYGTEALRIVGEGRGGFRHHRPHPQGPGGLPPRALRAARPDGARCVPPGDGVDLSPVLRRAALPPQRDHRAAPRGRGARPQDGRRLLSLCRWRGAASPPNRPRRWSSQPRRSGYRPARHVVPNCCALCTRWARSSKAAPRPPPPR